MKNTYIAAAITALMLPATGFAASNVQMYGIADAYIGFQDDDRAGGDGGMVVNSGGQSTSRLGFKGTEDIGGGLSALFILEGALSVDDGTAGGLSFTRRSIVGLKGGFGQITLGRNYTPLFWVVIDNDATRFAHDVNDANLGQNNRFSNALHYQNKFGAITLNAAYATETGNGDDGFGIGVRYKGGNWRVGLGYHDNDDGAGNNVFAVGGQMGFGAFKVGLNYVDDDANADPNIGLSLTTKIGAAGNLAVNFKDRNSQTEYAIYYRQSMSKRTNWYVGYGDEDANGTEFRAGIRHRF